MSNLIGELLLRAAKAAACLVIAVLIYLVAVGPLGATGSVELGLLSWVAACVFVLVVEESPI